MNKSAIEWCTHSNPDAYSCLHGCKFCYAIKIIKRFPMNFIGINQTFDRMLDLNPLVSDESITEIALKPHINLKALYGPAELKKPAIIFRGSMTDLFGDWWPWEFPYDLMRAMYEVPHHKYVILTKNPERMYNTLKHFPPGHFDHVYFGTSVDGGMSGVGRLAYLSLIHDLGFKTVISFEPLLEDPTKLIGSIKDGIAWADWIIIGGQTNPTIPPDKKWIAHISEKYPGKGALFVKGNAAAKSWKQNFPADLLPIAQSWGKA